MSKRVTRSEWRVLVLLGVVFALAGCRPGFQPRNFANPEALFRASLLEYQRKHWDNAQLGFERLSNDLSSNDPLLPPVLFYLALTHERRGEFLLASQAYQRVADGFPADTLAPRAVLGAGRSQQKLWRKPALDPADGQKAASTLRMLLSAYPASPEAAEAKWRIDTLDNWFAKKDYDTGLHYIRRGAVDPAIIYLKDVVTTYPSTPTARLAWLRLHELYAKIRWKEDAADACTAMWKSYPADADVTRACGVQPPAAVAPTTAPAVKTDTLRALPGMLARPGP